MVRPLLMLGLAYILGSIPFGYLIVKVTRGADIRETGSGGTGATNVSRRAGKVAGVVTLVLDALKGGATVFVAGWILGIDLFGDPIDSSSTGPYWWVAAAGVAAILGHMFPVWLGFRGGKGVATGVGVLLMLAPIAVAMAAVIFLVIVWRSRYVSLGSIVAAALIPLFVWLQDGLIRPVAYLIPTMSAAAAGAILIIFAHRANMRRLIDGTENKFK
jgi:acyl phosphate:glycerol-3-phosphate acyltransferase